MLKTLCESCGGALEAGEVVHGGGDAKEERVRGRGGACAVCGLAERAAHGAREQRAPGHAAVVAHGRRCAPCGAAPRDTRSVRLRPGARTRHALQEPEAPHAHRVPARRDPHVVPHQVQAHRTLHWRRNLHMG